MPMVDVNNPSPAPSDESTPRQTPLEEGSAAQASGNDAALILPTLSGANTGLYEVRRSSFLYSFTINIVVVVALVWIGSWTVRNAPILQEKLGPAIEIAPYILKNAMKSGSGSGGGGQHEKLPAQKGALPQTSKQQITPPSVHPPDEAKLTVAPSIVADVKVPPSLLIGDPNSKALNTISNGPGSGGGIGSGHGPGVGSHTGSGYGPDHYGGVYYKPGNGIRAPKLIFYVKPDFSEEARKNRLMGIVQLRGIIGVDGKVYNLSVVRSLGMGLDEKALEAVKLWRFEPGTKDGQPVAVEAFPEVTFTLY